MTLPGRGPAVHTVSRASAAGTGLAFALLLAGGGAFGQVTERLQGSLSPPQTGVSAAPSSEAADDMFSLDIDEQMDVGVPWPDLNAQAPDEPALPPPEPAQPEASPSPGGLAGTPPGEEFQMAADPEELADDGSERRYDVVLTGLDEVEQAAGGQFLERFNSLSLLKDAEGKPANIAQIKRRLDQDADLLRRALDAEGYYDAIIRPAIRPPETAGERVRAILDVRPGTRYTLSRISLPGLAIAAQKVPVLDTAFALKVGDPVDADMIMEGQNRLAVALGENGFPFATVEDPVVTIDHDVQKGDLEMVVRPGGYRLFGDILLQGSSVKLFSARHLSRISRFDKGDVYNATDVEDLRRAIIATGLVSSATVEPRRGEDAQYADIAVDVSPAPMRTIAGELGYGTGEGFRAEASWQHRNFFPPEGALTLRGLAGTREQAAGVLYRRNNFRRRDVILSAGLSVRNQTPEAYDAKSVTLSGAIERQTNVLFQKTWSWSVGAELIATRERGFFADALVETERDYLIVALPGSLVFDASDNLLDPTRGFRIGIRLSPEVARRNGTFTYARAQIDGSLYMPVSDRVVLASRARLGTIAGGVAADRIAPSRRFYAGGGASVRGYAYQSIGPRDLNNDPLGGKSLAEFSIEARVRFGSFGVVPFIDAGNISRGFLPDLGGLRYGAGLGVRYYSSFGPIRIDVGTPLNRQPGDPRVAVYVSLGQAF